MVLGGRKPSPFLLEDLKNLGWELWAVDKGLESCKRVCWRPSMVLGDMDSVHSEALNWAQRLGVPMDVHPVDKDLTDFQLALERASKISSLSQGEAVPVLATGCVRGKAGSPNELYDELLLCPWGCASWHGRSSGNGFHIERGREDFLGV
ncbi:hypothetical protein [Thermanaerovibrio velox]|nr:hypothetical protein [Thermanaerovibrio velox]